jgi:glucosamine--fructose-6-phosphate aminotransferase (isomerizing)
MPTQDRPPNFPHWMLEEIHEQPHTLAATLGHYVEAGAFRPSANRHAMDWLVQAEGDIVIAASGSSRHAGMAAELLIEDLSGIAVDVEYASEYCCRDERALKDASIMVISQSGETADTLGALRKARDAGHRTLAVTNVPHSSMAREADVSYATLAGSERAIPATKSFTAQLLVLHLLALLAARARSSMSDAEVGSVLRGLEALPNILASRIPDWSEQAGIVAQHNRTAGNFLFLGRGLHYPIAREGALKLKESSYLHAEGYPSGELKHGPNAIVDDSTPLTMIATVDRSSRDSIQRYDKVVQLMRDMRQQGAKIIAIANDGDHAVASLSNQVLFVPPLSETLLPFAEVIVLQLFAYRMATQAGIDVDHPRNLVKAVVAE